MNYYINSPLFFTVLTMGICALQKGQKRQREFDFPVVKRLCKFSRLMNSKKATKKSFKLFILCLGVSFVEFLSEYLSMLSLSLTAYG